VLELVDCAAPSASYRKPAVLTIGVPAGVPIGVTVAGVWASNGCGNPALSMQDSRQGAAARRNRLLFPRCCAIRRINFLPFDREQIVRSHLIKYYEIIMGS